jgi:phage repressor protein C with HTH and peptisase S24 domain
LDEKSPDWVEFGERLLEVARDKGGVQPFTRALGLSDSGYRKWVRGESEPDRSDLLNICQQGGVRILWLITGELPKRATDVLPVAEPRPSYPSLQTVPAQPDEAARANAVFEAIEEFATERGIELTKEKRRAAFGLLYKLSLQPGGLQRSDIEAAFSLAT